MRDIVEYQYHHITGKYRAIPSPFSNKHTHIQVRMRIQLNSVLFAKTLVRKDVASSSSSSSNPSTPAQPGTPTTPTTPSDTVAEKKDEEEDFSSKAQIMTLMTTDVDRVSDFSWHLFSLVGTSWNFYYLFVFFYHFDCLRRFSY